MARNNGVSGCGVSRDKEINVKLSHSFRTALCILRCVSRNERKTNNCIKTKYGRVRSIATRGEVATIQEHKAKTKIIIMLGSKAIIRMCSEQILVEN